MRIPRAALSFSIVAFLVPLAPSARAQSFVNFETPHVHPLELTPDGLTLLAVNTADDRLEVFDVLQNGLLQRASIPVGVDPVTVRARSNVEAWVVNNVSDDVSIVDLASGNVVRTLRTHDEPCDVVFAGAPTRAFVSCSQANQVEVFDLANLAAAPTDVAIDAEDPRALAVSPDGSKVYAAIFNSGNGSTILGGGSTMSGGTPPNAVSDPSGPYGGQNPPPNNGAAFSPPINGALPAPPKVGLIVKKDALGKWMDDNAHDWSPLVSGASANVSGRPTGWDLPDRDIAIIDANTLAVSYATRLMNICMAIAVNPVSGQVAVVGTDGTNSIRFEPVLKGKFLRVEIARTDAAGATLAVTDLNPHLTYATASVAQSERDKSLGDPRGIAWNAAGTKAYVTGMGSNNVIVIDQNGARAGLAPTIAVGEGPTGVAFHPTLNRVYVLNKFAGSISVINAQTETEVFTAPFFDPSPTAIKLGRKHLYDTHKNSGLGQIACGSCHVDARMDRLAWDLGDPTGTQKSTAGQNLGMNVPGLNTGFQPWHPMKGPMTTQTLQDIIGQEPLHWRGDRAGIEEFNPAFQGLQGDDVSLTVPEMQEFEDFLATIYFGPNPYRTFTNDLPTSVDTGMRSPGRFSAKGTPLPLGNAQTGLTLYRPPNVLDTGALACSTCHTLQTGLGSDSRLVGVAFQSFPVGPNGERHHALVSRDGSTNVTMKIPQIRNAYLKTGFDTTLTSNTSGFGYLHDGSVDTIASFVAEPVFNLTNDQQIADLVAFVLAFSGSELPYGGSLLEPPGTASHDSHAAVGWQTTLVDSSSPDPGQIALIDSMIAEANTNSVALIVKGRQSGIARGYRYDGANNFQSDRAAEIRSAAQLKNGASPGNELTFTMVPKGTETRAGIDRDLDGFFDRDELDAGSNPADAGSVPGCGTITKYGQGCPGSGAIVPRLDLTGCPKSNGAVTLSLRKGLGGSFAFVFVGTGQAALPMGGGCTLNVSPLVGPVLGPLPLSAGGAGDGSFNLPTVIPPVPIMVTVMVQAMVADPGVPIGFANTNGVQLTVLP